MWPTPLIPKTVITKKDIKKATSDKETDYLQLILNARVYDVAIESPLVPAKLLSAKLKNQIFLKREDMQPVFSFKCRGAYNRMSVLTPEERKNGVITVSAGNHAQGVALAAKKLGIRAVICMPLFAPEIKIDNVKRLGAEVYLCGQDFDSAKIEMLEIQKQQNLTFIPAFDDPLVIAGQGTIGVEILRQLRQERLDAIFVCVGGGGLIAGIAAYVKRVRPEVRIIGVNTFDSDGMYQSLVQKKPLCLQQVGLFSDGTAVRAVGKETFRLCEALVDDFVLVSTDEICAAIKDTFDDTRSILEPSGALAVAGCKKYLLQNQIENGVFCCVLSGANMNFDRIRFVAERSLLGEGKEMLLDISISEKKGNFRLLYSIVYPRNITEISYRFSNREQAHVFLAVESNKDLLLDLQRNGIHCVDCTDNEFIKNHGRYLVGGRSSGLLDEKVYRVSFAERPGALKHFFSLFKDSWNVTLVHYRNHGADTARVLVGVQVPIDDQESFTQVLTSSSYSFVDETQNKAFQSFVQ